MVWTQGAIYLLFYLPPYTYYPPPTTVYIKKNVGVLASMLYVYYKFHMQCVNQQKVDKKKLLYYCDYVTTKKKSESKIYIYQTNKQIIHEFLLDLAIFLSKIICNTHNLW